MHYMELGGAEMALIGLLGALNPNKVDVDLFIHSHQGALMQFIPKWINLLPEVSVYSVIERPISEALRRGHINVVARRLLAKLKHHNYIKTNGHKENDASELQYVGDCVTPCLPKINPDVEYDLCISFLSPHNIGRDKINAKKRLAWIHTDYLKININPYQELPVWSAYDHIASISPEVTKSFVTLFPSLKEKILPIENILSTNFVRNRAEEFNVSDVFTGNINLLSVGRFCPAKNYDNVPTICNFLRSNGIDAKWYIIGYGGDEGLIRQRIIDSGMEEYVIILGKKDNPYPYIKACDVYIQPSRYEGKSVTVREAQILCKPVVVTNYPTAPSQINDGVDGVIVPLDNKGCARGLAEFICNKKLQAQIIANLRKGNFAQEFEVEKIYNLLQ